ncbi:MAG: hypothetical protein SWN10_24185 [Pseudomonadota bacterium]|nr:hypothetical protein [Pseudomonadota bacterium]
MSRNILARASALSLVFMLAACGGDDSSSPLAPVGPETGGGADTGGGTGIDQQQEVVALGIGEGASFIEGQMQTDITSLPPRGTTSLSVSVVNAANGNTLITDRDVEVGFRSGCITNGTATISSPVITGSGIAQTTYTANGCFPSDTVTAFTDDAQASVVLSIESAEADRIISKEPEFTSIAPWGSGSSTRLSESEVSFQVVDQAGDPVPGVQVSFRISGDTASPSIPVTIDPITAQSDSNGDVSTLVIAGSDSTVVRVIAGIQTVNGKLSETQSPPIAINSTIPIETGLTLTASNFIPDAQFIAGVEVELGVLATDKNGQNVRGNTMVNFTATGGSVTPECPLDNDGTCAVIWRSQAPWLTRPTITATTIGETTAGTVGAISESVQLFVSSSRDPKIDLVKGTEENQYCASANVEAADQSRIHPADGTTIEFSISEGEILSAKNSFSVNGENGVPDDTTQFTACVFAKLTDATMPGTLTATVTTPGNEIDEDLLTLPATETP